MDLNFQHLLAVMLFEAAAHEYCNKGIDIHHMLKNIFDKGMQNHLGNHVAFCFLRNIKVIIKTVFIQKPLHLQILLKTLYLFCQTNRVKSHAEHVPDCF